MAIEHTADELTALITALETKLGGGMVEIEFEGHRTRYDTAADKIAALTYLRWQLGVVESQSALAPRSRVTRLYSNKGL